MNLLSHSFLRKHDDKEFNLYSKRMFIVDSAFQGEGNRIVKIFKWKLSPQILLSSPSFLAAPSALFTAHTFNQQQQPKSTRVCLMKISFLLFSIIHFNFSSFSWCNARIVEWFMFHMYSFVVVCSLVCWCLSSLRLIHDSHVNIYTLFSFLRMSFMVKLRRFLLLFIQRAFLHSATHSQLLFPFFWVLEQLAEPP